MASASRHRTSGSQASPASRGEGLEPAPVVVIEGPAPVAVGDLEHADDLVVAPERHARGGSAS